jgi:membrane protease YdiL (CAAX protease family)
VSDPPAGPRREVEHALWCGGLWLVGAFASRAVGLWFGVGTAAVLLGVLAVVLERRSLRALFRVDGRAVVAGLAMGAFMTAATYALYGPVTRAVPAIGRDVAGLYATFGASPLTHTALLLPIPILGEELVWRGLVQSALARRVGPVAAAVLGALAYAAAHGPVGSVSLTLACLGCGLCWGALRAFTGGLLAPLIAHLLWDFAVLLVWPLPG